MIKKDNGLIKMVFMVIISCLTQIITILKSSIIAGNFGVSNDMDAFNFANSIASFIFSFVIAGISTVVIPCYVKKIDIRKTNAFLTFVFTAVLFISMLVLVARNILIGFITGQEQHFVLLSGNILIVLIVSNFFSVFSSITAAYFQYAEKYNLPKVITLLSQTFVVLILIVFKDITIYQYTLILGFGLILNAVIDMIFAIKFGWRFFPRFEFNEFETKRLLLIFLPILFSTGVYQFSLLIDSSIASRMNTGDVTVLNFANQISSMLNTLLVNNLLVYFYPKLVKEIEDGKEQFYFWDKTYFFHSIMCLVVAGYLTIGQKVISLLFEHGEFSAQATNKVFYLSAIYISAQQFNVIRDLIYRFFYSHGNTKATTINSIFATFINVISSLLLINIIGIYGIVIGTALSSIISLITIMIKFKQEYGYGVPIVHIFTQYSKTITITFLTIMLVNILQRLLSIEQSLLYVVVYGITVVFIYVVLTLIANSKIKQIALQI